MIPEFDFSAEVARAEQAHAAAVAELPALRAARQAAIDAESTAQHRYNLFVLRFNTAVRARSGAGDPAAAPLERLLEAEQSRLNQVRAAMMRARRDVETAEWNASSARLALEQLQRAQSPPPLEHRPMEVVPRPKPDIGTFDSIVMPAEKTAA
jgi:hypothetical protein